MVLMSVNGADDVMMQMLMLMLMVLINVDGVVEGEMVRWCS